MLSECIAGGCQCGRVRYQIAGVELPVYACHCRECQKQSASAFGLSVPIARDRLHVDGALASWERDTDLETRTRCYFCGECGSRLFHASLATPERVTVKGGSLDDTSRLRPGAHIWVSRKQPWVVLEDDVPTHETQPDDLAAWRDEYMGGAA